MRVQRAISSVVDLFIIRLVLALCKGAILVGKRPLRSQTRVDIAREKQVEERNFFLPNKKIFIIFLSDIEESQNYVTK